jgi:hypothetical protein
MRCLLGVPSAFFVAALVSGCSTGAEMEARRIQQTAAQTEATGKACIESVAADPQYASLKNKTYLGTDNQFPLAILTDKTYPTRDQIALLYKLYGDLQECRKIALDGFAKMHPLYLLVMVETFSSGDHLWAQFADGRMTWGNFNQARRDITTQNQTKMAQAATQVDPQLQNQHQFELQQRQRAAEAFRQWAYQQQVLINQRHAIADAGRPRTINCKGGTASS